MGSFLKYIPDQWNDEEFMSGIMSMLKNREVNSIDYDKKIRFWADVIANSCLAEKSPTFTIDTMKRRYIRGNKLPACLSQVIEQINQSGDIQTLSEWRSQHSTWLDWGMSKIGTSAGWLFGGNGPSIAPDEQLIHVPTLKKQADRIVDLIRRDLEADVEGTGDIIGFSEMYDKCTGVINNLNNFELILDELTSRGEISIGMSRGEKIIKFRDNGSKGPATFSESDKSVHDIRKTMGTLEKKISMLEKNISKLDIECRAALRAGEKTKAAGLLRKKKAAEKELAEKDGQIQRLLSMLHQIGATKHNKEVMEAYKAGSSAFKSTLERHGLSPDKIDETMDEVMNATEEYRDIEEALAQPINGIHDAARDAELEGELEALLAAEKRERAPVPVPASPSPIKLPAVPTRTLGYPGEDPQVDYADLERRLNRLKQTA